MIFVMCIIGLSIFLLVTYLFCSHTQSTTKFVITSSLITQLLMVILLISITYSRYYLCDILLIYGSISFVCAVCMSKLSTNRQL